MTSRSDVEIIAIDSTLRRIRPVANLVEATITPKLNPTSSSGVGQTTITVPPDDSINSVLGTPGTRLLVRYRDADEMSGLIRETEPAFTPDGEPIYTIDDDYQVLLETRAAVAPVAKTWPSGTSTSGSLHPTSLTDDGQAVSTVAHTAGTDAGYGAYVFDAQANGGTTLSAESAVKEAISRNLISRLGAAWLAARGGGSIVPFTIAADQQRGGDAFAAGKLPVLRFDSLADGLAPLLLWSGLRLRVLQAKGALTVGIDVSVGRTFPQTLTYASGVVQGGSPTTNAPTATRGILLGPGTDTARDYSSVANAALERTWGLVAETTRDASGADLNWPSSLASAYQVAKFYLLRSEVSDADKATYLAAFTQAGSELLADGAAKSGLGLTLAETDTFHYGGATAKGRVQLGDVVPVQAWSGDPKIPGATFYGPVTSATIKLERNGSVTATPVVGERTDDPDEQLQKALLELDTAFRRFTTRR